MPLAAIFMGLEERGKKGDISQAQPELDRAHLEFSRLRGYIESGALMTVLAPKSILRSLSMRILVADDDPTTLETLTRALERWNLEVVPAVNGREAWEILQQPDPPHMALSGLDDARYGRVGSVSVGLGPNPSSRRVT
jgi:hypothetical protein